jgi:hypothetical protein
VPVDAIRLAEDAQTIKLCLRLLDWIDPYNVSDDPNKGRKTLRFVIGQLKMAERYAEQKMRTEFLDPRKRKIERRRTTSV